MAQPTLHLVPFFGLGNRLNALASAIALNRDGAYNITAYWERTPDCRAWFDELFLPLEAFPVQRLTRFYMKPATRQNLWFPSLLRRVFYSASFKATHTWNQPTLLQPQPNWNRVYVEAHKRISPVEDTQLLSRIFRPVPEIESRISALVGQFAERTIGVHIRRTDHKVVIRENPLEGFIAEMQHQLTITPDCSFFLATDDSEVKHHISQLFPGRVLTMESSLSRSDLRGIQDAVIEMYALGSTSLIIGSRGSTFSELAAHLYNTPIVYPSVSK